MAEVKQLEDGRIAVVLDTPEELVALAAQMGIVDVEEMEKEAAKEYELAVDGNPLFDVYWVLDDLARGLPLEEAGRDAFVRRVATRVATEVGGC